jgi:hypothetical protein
MLSLLRKGMVPLKKFVRYYKCQGCQGCQGCQEDTNMFTTAFKVNLFTFIITSSIASKITRSHMILQNEIEQLRYSKKNDKKDNVDN